MLVPVKALKLMKWHKTVTPRKVVITKTYSLENYVPYETKLNQVWVLSVQAFHV